MPGIVTITFNPCIDKSFITETIVPDRKLACSMPRIDPGGGGINVARTLKKLGGSAWAIYPAGGPIGRLLTDLLTAEQVPVRPVPMNGETRENINVTEQASGRQYRFVVKGPALEEPVWTQCLAELNAVDKDGFIVVSGSLPEPWPEYIFRRIKAVAAAREARLVVDTSGKALEAAVRCGVHLIKPSLRELASLAPSLGVPADQPLQAARQLVAHASVELVVLSAGAQGAVVVTKDRTAEFRAPEVTLSSTVGAGDSLLAGILLSFSQGKDLFDAVRYGVACGTSAVMHPGTTLCCAEDVAALYPKVASLQPA